jgi:hypothetical protein
MVLINTKFKLNKYQHSFVALQELFIINMVLVALDISLLVIKDLNLNFFEIAFKGLVYSVS